MKRHGSRESGQSCQSALGLDLEKFLGFDRVGRINKIEIFSECRGTGTS